MATGTMDASVEPVVAISKKVKKAYSNVQGWGGTKSQKEENCYCFDKFP